MPMLEKFFETCSAYRFGHFRQGGLEKNSGPCNERLSIEPNDEHVSIYVPSSADAARPNRSFHFRGIRILPILQAREFGSLQIIFVPQLTSPRIVQRQLTEQPNG